MIKIYGCASEPTITYRDRGINQIQSEITTFYADGTYTIKVNHNGSLDLTINCSGTETNRSTFYPAAQLTESQCPPFYTGVRQYEGEFFDYKDIEENITNGCRSGITGYHGQGFLKFGTSATAAVRDNVQTDLSGTFTLKLRYTVTSSNNKLVLFVNGEKVGILELNQCGSMSDWHIVTQQIALKQGMNQIEIKAASALGSSKLGLSSRIPYQGGNSLLVSERSAAAEKFCFTFQYPDSQGQTHYVGIDAKTAVRGEYVQLYHPNF